MDRVFPFNLRRWVLVGSLLMLVVWLEVPGCTRRQFPPIRDAEAFVLEVYQVEVSVRDVDNHPEIEEVLTSRRTRLVAHFPVMKWIEEGAIVEAVATNKTELGIQAELQGVERWVAVFTLSLKSKEGSWQTVLDTHNNAGLADLQGASLAIRLPLDTWGVSKAEVDSESQLLRMLVYRVNSPGE